MLKFLIRHSRRPEIAEAGNGPRKISILIWISSERKLLLLPVIANRKTLFQPF